MNEYPAELENPIKAIPMHITQIIFGIYSILEGPNMNIPNPLKIFAKIINFNLG